MLKTGFASGLLSLSLCACGALPENIAETSSAITNGTVDSANTFRNVGALVIEDQGQLFPICSGTLIAPTVFLTASHCTSFLPDLGIDTVYVSFAPVFNPATSPLIAGTAHTHPLYGTHGNNDPHDIAVVTLAAAPAGATPATLPTRNQFGVLAAKNGLKNKKFTAVGYGVFERTLGGGQPAFGFDDTRRYATSSFNAIENTWLRLSQNASTGNGGTCYGDSGGPNFYENSSLVAGLTVTGDAPCRATNVIYRLDTDSARSFLAGFVALP